MKVTLISLTGSLFAYGLRIISSYLKKNGHSVNIIFIPVDITKSNLNALIRLLNELNSDLIGISVMSDHFNKAKVITKEIKKHFSTPIIFGGVHATIAPEQCLKYADMVGVGECEEAMLELCDKINKNKDYFSAPNIWFKKNGEIIRNKLRDLEENLDKYDLPDYENNSHYIFDKQSYTFVNDDMLMEIENNTYNTITSRGCPFSCTYCNNNYARNMYAKKVKYLRKRSISHIINELKWAKDRFKKLEFICFYDDIFLLRSTEDLKIFCKQYKKRFNLPFYAMGHPLYISEEKIKLLKEAGLKKMQVGIESGSERILYQVYNRKTPKSTIIKMAEILHKYQLEMVYDIIFNNPYESLKDCKETLELLLEFPKPFFVEGGNLVFYPGTEIYEKAKVDSYISDDPKKLKESSPLTNINLLEMPWAAGTRQSSLLYVCYFSNKQKHYINMLILLTPYLPEEIIRYFLNKESIITKLILVAILKFRSFASQNRVLIYLYGKWKRMI